MYRRAITLIRLAAMLACSTTTAAELTSGKVTGDIVLRDDGREIVYTNIVGEKEGFERRLITINGGPALVVSARYDFYYTLKIYTGEVLVDCAYFDVRNTYNGSRATAGICELDTRLDEDYGEIAQDYSNVWRSSFFSFDTASVIESGIGKDFLLGRVGDIEIFDRYASADDLINSSPQKIIKRGSGCFNFGKAVVFLVFLNKDKPSLRYLDVLRSNAPMVFERLGEDDLRKIAIEECT